VRKKKRPKALPALDRFWNIMFACSLHNKPCFVKQFQASRAEDLRALRTPKSGDNIMLKFRQPLKHALHTGASPHRTAKLFAVSPTSVRKWVKRAEKIGLNAKAIDEMSDSELDLAIRGNHRKPDKVHPDWEAERAYLEQGYNLSEAHIRYVELVGEKHALSYSAYCENMRKHAAQKPPILRLTHVPGFAQQSDYASFTPRGLAQDGSERTYQLFLCVLPYSHYVYATCVPSQTSEDYIWAHIGAMEYFGGAPVTTVTDNLKAAITKYGSNGRSILNPKFAGFAEYYGLDVQPARPKRPQDKAAVEVAVKIVQRLLRLALKNRPLLRLHDLNKLLREIIEKLNRRPMKRAGGKSRLERFVEHERDKLRPLPSSRLSFLDLPETRNVEPDYHISFDSSRYSVHYSYIGKKVTVRGSANAVEIRFDNKIIAQHPRSHIRDSFVTDQKHRPPNHQAFLKDDLQSWLDCQDPVISEWAQKSISKKAGNRDKGRILAQLRKLKSIYGMERLCNAVRRASDEDLRGFSAVRDILSSNFDMLDARNNLPERPAPRLNVRGPEYFAEGGAHVL
jgi:transposase